MAFLPVLTEGKRCGEVLPAVGIRTVQRAKQGHNLWKRPERWCVSPVRSLPPEEVTRQALRVNTGLVSLDVRRNCLGARGTANRCEFER